MHQPTYAARDGIVTVLLLASVGCGGDSDANVKQAFLEYRSALAAGDKAGIRARVTAEKADALETPEADQLLEMVRTLAPESPALREITVRGDSAFLALTAEWEGKTISGTVELVRESGTWKVGEEQWTMELTLGGGGGGFAGRLLADRAARPVKQASWKGHEGSVTRVAFLADGSSLATVGYDDTRLCLWDVRSGILLDEVTLENRPTDMAALPDGGVVVGDVYGTLTVVPRDVGGWSEPRRFRSQVGGITRLAVSPDGRRVVTTSFEQPLRIWNLEMQDVEEVLDGPTSLRGVAFSPSGDLLAAGGYGNTFVTWQVEKGPRFRGRVERSIPKVDKHSDVYSVAFSPDGGAILTGHLDSSITVWESHQGKQLHNVYVPQASTLDVAWCPDGTLFATAQQDGCIYLWDRETATPLAKLRAHEGPVKTVAFDPGQWELFASGGEDGQIAIWR